MVQSGDTLGKLIEALAQWAARGRAGSPAGLLGVAAPLLGARGGALLAWRTGGAQIVSATRGLPAPLARRLRALGPAAPADWPRRLGWAGQRLLQPGQTLASGWRELDLWVEQGLLDVLAPGGRLAWWPLAWGGGWGLALWLLPGPPEWPPELARSAAAGLGLALGNLLWRRRQDGGPDDIRQRALIAAILEVMPVAVFVVDRQHRVLHWNRACQELTGVAGERIMGSDRVWEVFHRPPGISLADLIVEGDQARLRAFYADERLRPSPIAPEAWQADSHFPDLGGRPKDLIFTAAPLRDPGGQIMGAVEAILDLTDLKRLEAQLAESEALYRSLVEANREGIALHDGEAFLFANQPFLEMFGLTALEQAPEDFLELLSPASQGAYLRWRRTLGAQGVSPLFEGQGQRGGTGFDLEMNAAPAVYKGRPALLFNIRDVTYRKSMEEQLIRSERLAATGKLAFDIAHEVNNPLGGILTFAHLMAEDLGADHELRPTVDKIIKLTNRCKIIIRGMLDFARQDPPQKELMDLNQVISETLSLLEGHVLLRGVELVLLLEPGLPSFYGHRGKLEQVFLNLIINAAEALEGRGRLAIRTWAEPTAREIRVRLADDGPGMEEDVALRAFEPFFTTKARGRGTGLGLAICFGIVKQHEGRVELETAPGLGAAFTVVLPMNAGG